jgi:hypothetical protein
MPVYYDGYKIKNKKQPRCKAGHLSMCSKKPNCSDCGLLKLKKLEKRK